MLSEKKLYVLIISMMTICLLVVVTAEWLIYGAAVEEEREDLNISALYTARWIETLIREKETGLVSERQEVATDGIISEIAHVHHQFRGFTGTNELLIARRDDADLVYLLAISSSGVDDLPERLRPEKGFAEPMLRALAGETGSMQGLDYQGRRVLAAYVPITGRDWGVVAKVDLAEIREPFISYGMLTIGLSLALTAITAYIFMRITTPLTRSLRESQARFRATFEQASVGICLVEPEGHCLRVNHHLCEIFGYQPEEMHVTQTIRDITQSEDAKTSQDSIQKLLAGEMEDYTMESRCRRKDGTWVWVRFNISSVRDDLNEPMYFIYVLKDITALHEAEERLAALAAIVESTEDAIIGKSLDGHITSWNAGAEELYGYSAAEIVGQPYEQIIPPAKRKEFKKFMERIVNGTSVIRFETLRVNKEGQKLDVAVTLSAIKNPKGDLIGISGINTDISEWKKVEKELRKAKETAEKANEVKSEFLANMSHEIRTPLNGIIGMVELVLDSPLTARQKEFLIMAKYSADSLLTVINDILDFSKIEAGKLNLSVAPYHLRDAIEGTTATLALRAYQKGIELACHISPEVPDAILGDAVRLRQILINLLGNAVKFTHQGEIVVDVGLTEGPKAENPRNVSLHVSVRDTGIGIPPEKQATIFSSFEQADASTTREYGGTGLGLTISAHLVELMGGEIWVESTVGQGSTFHFTIQVEVDETDAGHPTTVDALKGLRVLAVDDNETNRRILLEVLTLWGLKPTLADDGEAALTCLTSAAQANTPFHLLLTDMHMPRMDGIELVTRLRQVPGGEKLPIIVLSSAGNIPINESIESLAIDYWLSKPIRQSELLTTILGVMGMSHMVKPDPMLSSAALISSSPQPSIHILLAEDNEINQELALAMLQKWGHTVTLAHNGQEALNAYEKENFDLVLMDVRMPVMDGFQATAAIRKQEQASGSHIPIIALTAHAMEGDREQCLEAGMDGYATKPINPTDLHAAIAKFLLMDPPDEKASTEASTEEAFDLDAALLTTDGNLKLLEKVMRIFLDQASARIKTLQTALDDDDAETLHDTAHQLKGMVGNFGAKAAVRSADRLQKIAQSGTLKDAPLVVATLGAEIDSLIHEINLYLKEGSQ